MSNVTVHPRKRTQAEMFLVLVTDAVAALYPSLDLRADQPLPLDMLQTKMAQAGLLEDGACDG